MIGYMIEQELGNILPFEQPFATILSMVEVDPDDPAFENPTKPIGPVYTEEESRRLAAEKGWTMAPDGDGFRRVVASPMPKRIFQIRPVKWLLEKGCIVICAGGGGIPTMYGPKAHGCRGSRRWWTRTGRAPAGPRAGGGPLHHGDGRRRRLSGLGQAHAAGDPPGFAARPSAAYDFATGSMGPKVEAAVDFAERTGKTAAIGALADVARIARGEAGTHITPEAEGVEYYP